LWFDSQSLKKKKTFQLPSVKHFYVSGMMQTQQDGANLSFIFIFFTSLSPHGHSLCFVEGVHHNAMGWNDWGMYFCSVTYTCISNMTSTAQVAPSFIYSSLTNKTMFQASGTRLQNSVQSTLLTQPLLISDNLGSDHFVNNHVVSQLNTPQKLCCKQPLLRYFKWLRPLLRPEI